MSTLQPDTAEGWTMANLLSDLMAANLSTDLGDERKSCKTRVNGQLAHSSRNDNAKLYTHRPPAYTALGE